MEKMKVILWPLVTSFLITVVLMPFIIRYFKMKQFGQVIRDEGPSWHEAKSGTPTMGGIVIILSAILTVLVTTLIDVDRSLSVWLLTAVFVLYGLIGFIDDFIKLFMKRNLGLTSRQKFLAQVVIGIIFYLVLIFNGFNNQLNLPIIGNLPLGYLYGFFAVFWLVGFSNATNLTDGIDGLMASTGTIAYAAYAYIAYMQEQWGVLVFALSVIGGLIGFLIFNRKPAKIFMGDVGSLALGAGLAAMSILLNVEWTLLLIGLIFVLETASVMLQVFWFKRTGNRIFKMSPIHHHFEMDGWSEWKIVGVFAGVGLLMAILTLVIIF
ncbi:phospho-N-acetylmuramoyl-pentapeptide-transferase [Carnobacteriaceae bacterium 52-44]|jgi:phospho-N-acetylmuramoyl-pentapeptide-transferase